MYIMCDVIWLRSGAGMVHSLLRIGFICISNGFIGFVLVFICFLLVFIGFLYDGFEQFRNQGKPMKNKENWFLLVFPWFLLFFICFLLVFIGLIVSTVRINSLYC